ncbi:toxin TcdB middle/N-terminal domain-containing protein, partial [Treponema sp.]|uniref:toxin TcdB middle/N-terminal domain-containing protein n=1 Tax=Treponema sp. TaxID=166 RepID=UPI00388EB0C9
MEKVNEQITNEERKYGKRTAALVLTVMYMATLSPLYLFAEERRKSASAVENFYTSITYAPLNAASSNEKQAEQTEEKEIHVAEAPAVSIDEERSGQTKASDSEQKVPVMPESVEASALITKKAGGVIELGRVKIEIPAKAVKEDTEISITRLGKVKETGETLKNVTEENGGYRFLPKGTKFKKKVLISMPYSKELNLTEGELEELYTYFYDEEKSSWVKLERKEIDKENCLVKSYTTHFTDMINATLAMPEVTGPVDFNINSIKGLEAARPDGHLLKFNPPQGTSSGDAAFSFTLDVPAGRKGMQPQVSVGYSSAGGSGIMGKGFDVNYGSTISIDTRKRLPDYDESDAYLKDGVKLKANGSTNKEYRLLRRSVREKIERHNAFSRDDWWEITDTHGTVYRYGYYKSYESTTNNAFAGKKDEDGKDKIYAWYLSEVEDIDGNTILYEYEKDKEYVYPSKITYTGNVKDSAHKEGKYTVKFNYIKNSDDRHRHDVRVDARSRFVTECRWLLDSIESGYNGNVTRKYSFSYEEGLAKEKYLTALTVKNGKTENSESYTYSFAYNELEKITDDNGTVTYKIFDEPKIWLSSEDKINEVFNNQIPGKNDLDINNVSMSSSSSTGYNVNAGFGVGVGTSAVDARVTGGGGGSSSSGTGYTNTVLIDINGDGISDIVKQNGNSIDVYLCNYDREAKTFSYSATASNQYIGTQINLEETESSSTSYNVYGGGGASVIGAGYSYAHTDSSGSTQTKTGFADVDGDGLVDIVTGSTTYLRNTSKGNEISFEKKTIKGYASSRVKKLTTAEKNEYSMQFMAQRPFRAWKVKRSGKVDIIQSILNSDELKGNVYIDNSKNPADGAKLKNLEVKDGQYIYFVPDLKNGKENWNNSINWNIQIDYNTVKPFLSNDNEIILALPCAAELYNPSSRNSSIKDKNLNFLSDLYEPREDTSSGSGYATYYAGLKNGYESIELTETQRLIILSGEYFIPKRIENYKAAGNASFIGLLKRAAEPPKSDIYPDKRGAVKTVLDSYKYDYVNDCFRYKNNRTTAAEKQTLREALKTVGYSYEKFLGDYRKDFAGITIGNSGLAKPVLYAAVTGREENNSQRKVNTRGRLSDNIIIIDDDILGEKTEEFNLISKTVKCGNDFSYSGFEGDNNQPVIKIADKENKYIISYCFGNLTYAVPELSDEEFEKIYNSEYMNGSITEGIINELKTLEETPEGKDYKIINKDSAEQVVKGAFATAVAQKLLNENDADVFISIVLDSKDDDYVLKTLNDDDNNKIRGYDKKLKLADFISNDFSYYYKAEADSSYWTLKSGLEKEEKEELENICKRYGFGLYQNFYKRIDYIKDGEYVVSDSKYNVLILEGNTWENRPINFTEAKNNSFEQYSNKDLTVRESNAKIGSYSAPYLDKRGNIATKPVDLTIENEDTLYGGVNSWLYGIWQGNQTENPFSKEKLVNRTTKEINEDDYKDYDEEEMAGKYETDVKDNGENVKEKFDLSYYLPLDTTGYEKEGVWNAECGIEKESLTGNIDIKESQTVTDANGRMAVVRTTVYSAPYIYKDKIVCNRLGGDTYYNIEGISQSSSVGTFCISKSRNKNKETSHGPQVKAAVIDLSGSFSDGSGSSYQEQSFQDVTGDRIPDIIQSDGKKLTVKKGILEGKNLFFEDYDVSGISNYISVSENENSTKSAGVGLSSPAAEPKYNAKGIAKSISMSMGCNGSKGDGHNKQTAGFIDLNGDGITDYVNVDDGEYKIGNGQDFKTESFFAKFIPLQESNFNVDGSNIDLGAGGSITSKTADEDLLKKLTKYCEDNNVSPKKIPECAQKLSCSVNVGVGFGNSTSTSSVKRMYLDVNADGLLDIIEADSQIPGTAKVRFNTGSAFTDNFEQITLPKWDDTNMFNPLTSNVSTTVTLNGSVGVSVNVSVPVWFVTINFTTSVGGGNNTSSTVNVADITMTDLDGDGKADQVLQLADGSVYWKKNLTGKAGLLNSIYLPQGGKYEIEYEGEYGTTYNPGFKYVMSEVKVSDGTEAILPQIKIINDDDDEEKDTHEFITRYSYEDAYFDREEKDSYGYNKVKTTYPDDTYGVTQYSTKTTEYSYNLLGATMTSEVYSSEQKGYKDNEGCMSSTDIEYFNEEEWTLPKTETSVIYEKDGGCIESTTEYGYDEDSNEEYGNVTSVKQTTSDS